MSDMTDFLEDAVLENVLNNAANPASTSVFIALFTAAPSDTGGGTEVATGSYARVSMTGGFTVAGTATRAENTAAVIFPTATADWGTVTHVGIFDALTVGNLLFHRALTTPRTVLTDDIFQFAIGDLGVTLT